MKVKLKPISKRAKDRVNQHGDTFELVKDAPKSNCGHQILVESLNNTWRGAKWMGWFEVGKDVTILSKT